MRPSAKVLLAYAGAALAGTAPTDAEMTGGPSAVDLTIGRPLSPEATRRIAAIVGSGDSPRQIVLVITGFATDAPPADREMPAELQRARHAGVALRVSCVVRPSTCYVADDVVEWCEASAVTDVTFYAGREFLTRHEGESAGVTTEHRFHASMFFERLSRVRTFDWGRRAYYRRVADLIEAGAVSDTATAGPLGPSVRDLADVGARIVAAKVGQLRPARRAEPVRLSHRPASRPHPGAWRHVLITGWYGTETHGDKAILGEVLEFLRQHAPGCRITLSTIHSRISRQTEWELPALAGTRLVAIEGAADPALIESVDAVIMGGGPLMESASMADIWRIFAEANRQGKARIIFGCGVGPIHTGAVRELTADVLRVATAGFVRDQESHDLASELSPGHVLKVACDPAVAFVDRWRRTQRSGASRITEGPRIAGLVRANTNEFDVSGASAVAAANETTARHIAECVAPVCAHTGATFELLHMNAHWVGGDDRLMNRRIERAFGGRPGVITRRDYLPLEAHMSRMASADAALAMRYHGHVFSLALGVPFLSIDYTGATGKVGSLLRRIGYEGQSQPWGALDPSRASAALTALLQEREAWSAHLLARTARLVDEFTGTVREVFELTGEGAGAR